MTGKAGVAARVTFERLTPDGKIEPAGRQVAAETPVAIECNGVGYAVLMATPDDLEDLAHGFALSERLIDGADDIRGVDAHETSKGVVLRLSLDPKCNERLFARVRHRVSESSCGLCGIENLDQALRELPRIAARSDADAAAIFRAIESFSRHQPLNRLTGAVHGAALCAADGSIRLAREDVGRHNAFDKLIGAMARQRLGWDGGFALLSSRCSFELVEKAALAHCPLLVTISAPTALAVERARQAGLELVVIARQDSCLVLGNDGSDSSRTIW